MRTKEMILTCLSSAMSHCLTDMDEEKFGQLTEIRIRVDKPLLVRMRDREYAVGQAPAAVSGPFVRDIRDAYRPVISDVQETLERISRHSLYAFEEELRMGYITLPGGHRVGVTGKTVLDNGSIRTIRPISGLNIRIAHQIKGCATPLLPLVVQGRGKPLCHTMLISPPGCGKTTVLRDIVRQLSDGVPGLCDGLTVGVVDERSELAGCYRGVAQNDIGLRTDVLDGCPKAEGMILLLRAMSPDVIAVDELGGERDARAAEDVLNAGVKLLCTVHGQNHEDIRGKPILRRLLENRIFERFVVLESPGWAAGVYDADGKALSGRMVIGKAGLPC